MTLPAINTDLFYATTQDAKDDKWTNCKKDIEKLTHMLDKNPELVWSMGVGGNVEMQKLDGANPSSFKGSEDYLKKFNDQLLAWAAEHDLSNIIDRLSYRNGANINYNEIKDFRPPSSKLFIATPENAKNNTWTQCKDEQDLQTQLKSNPNLVWSVGVGGNITQNLDGKDPTSLKGNEAYLKAFNEEIIKYNSQFDLEEVRNKLVYRNGTQVNAENLGKDRSIIYKMTKEAPDNPNIVKFVKKIDALLEVLNSNIKVSNDIMKVISRALTSHDNNTLSPPSIPTASKSLSSNNLGK